MGIQSPQEKMPALEFWITGYALISGAGFVFALGLTALGVGPVLSKPSHKRIVWSAISVIALLTWWQLAKHEEAKSKPERDYVYFVFRDDNGSNGTLVSIATGPLRDVAVAIQTAQEREKGSKTYIYGDRIPLFNEDRAPFLSGLPFGDYWIDSDPPTTMGKVLEHLKIQKIDNKVVTEIIFVMRKATRETLIPEPPIIAGYGAIVLFIICLAFTAFAVTLMRGSWITT